VTEPMPGNAPALLDRLGERARRRAAPRLGIALAGAGSALVVVGMLVLSGYELGVDSELAGGGGSGRVPGIVLSIGVVAFGYVLLAANRTGPLAAAGVAASALATPAAVFFLTFDEGAPGTPVSVDAILLVSTGVWAFSYLAGPGRGHAFYLGSALIGLWYFVTEQVEPVLSESAFFGFALRSDGDSRLSTIGMVALLFGMAYLLAAWAADRRGFAGTATPLVAAGNLALASGVVALSPDLEAAGTGMVAIAFGIVLAAFGARTGRRLTTWLGAGGVFAGVALVLGDVIGDEARPLGVCLMLAGVAVVTAAHMASRALAEAPEYLDA
jgi:hypothetical protein